MIRGVRGAVTIEHDDAQLVLQETTHLMQEMIAANHIEPENVASVIVSTTPDIVSAFPAKAVRTLENWNYVPVMCMHEMNVPGALPLCIRVLIHVDTDEKQKDIRHIYLNDAIKLRPDLAK
ncbi:chorismate mutase [Rummeliibacillus sp. SL167]|uniref:chorismate mutase n=1 Tax=Rummeliibacillus sp. SL167 TaxID=2579792 RepID=UPI0011B4C7CA|nr:chorismate mutase [Rummeliibacillus sp. SL167]